MESSQWAGTGDAYSQDQFAQTREPDNLFDDDITPVTEPITQTFSAQIPPDAPRAHASPYRGSQLADGRSSNFRGGRGRARATRPGHIRPPNGHRPSSNPKATTMSADNSEHISAPATTLDAQTEAQDPAPPAAVSTNTIPTSTGSPSKPTDATQSQAQPPAQRTPAVRGPRLLTGGVQRPKLSEDELSARLAAAKLNNSKLEAAHRLAEADAANFEAREQAAKERRVAAEAARKQMEGERERNRLRKLGAKTGREWDVEKDERQQGLGGEGRGRGGRRGMYGGVVGGLPPATRGEPGRGRGENIASKPEEVYGDSGDLGGLSEVAVGEDAEGNTVAAGGEGGSFGGGFRGRGRGRGRGPRGGRGRGRGDSGMQVRRIEVRPSALTEEDFPALQTSNPMTKPQAPATALDNPLRSPDLDKATWADQVEAGQAQQVT